MKANLETAKKYLKEREEVLSSLYCIIEFGYINRSGILVATNEKLLFCADYMFRNGLKWEFKYDKILNFNENNGVVYGAVPFIEKLLMHYEEDFIVFTNFSNPSKVNEFSKVIKSKVEN
ncbi:PH domain-containing protein [Neobacillus sp. PS3-34]|uniref:PH domain-containing protein n=1 Tax=Neobacillus sp. PS3-34 TaxID=3070678 RepID=UPI0027E19077|nr:PH domain-containing protein [Neobacillus sp. PS3-34]WML48692.1 PH domain-containing protein [Neobacillus sp. PS3-34]